ncbi:nucleotidyltransferase domain-containing protein [Tepidibacter formicigenes]|jgi:predicted nucleotidyltransferase|uniref:Nucleotidyltransferase domain-containing protein n=1 Tax=Tepidibacter formicigenes DSM 15518 TaxID=1123349 RepID=A0A1M6U1A6_9FIRM|nr:nucleotidyltransferase domain-containing protein [Tepidibacter formicigenes]SHK62924.1 Nucleotidyltransferase domain-containing protein [Tepidibacter formicigenes DSM 15518]
MKSYKEIIENHTLPKKFKYKIIKSIMFLLSKYQDDTLKIILFGSCAKSQVKETSDVDLALVIKGSANPKLYSKIRNELWDNEIDDDIETDLYFISEKLYNSNEFEKSIPYNIIKKGITLYVQ